MQIPLKHVQGPLQRQATSLPWHLCLALAVLTFHTLAEAPAFPVEESLLLLILLGWRTQRHDFISIFQSFPKTLTGLAQRGFQGWLDESCIQGREGSAALLIQKKVVGAWTLPYVKRRQKNYRNVSLCYDHSLFIHLFPLFACYSYHQTLDGSSHIAGPSLTTKVGTRTSIAKHDDR